MKLPKISVVTPSYQQGKFLEETILSVLGQNYPNLEYIVIDGGSTDESVTILQKYTERLSYWTSEKDGGQSEAINKGFEKASGDILCWLNSDDLYFPGSLFKMAQLAEPSIPAIYFADCLHFSKNGSGVSCYGSDVCGASQSHQLRHLDYIIQPSSFWTRKAWLQCGKLSETLHYTFDWEWYLRAESFGIAFKPTNEILSLYRIHGEHKTGTGGSKRRQEIIDVSKVYAPDRVELLSIINNENLDFNKLEYKVTRKLLRSLGRHYTENSLLKLLKRSRYRGYSVRDIDESRSMLFMS